MHAKICFETISHSFDKLMIMTQNQNFPLEMRRMTFGSLMSDKFPVMSEDREVFADLKKMTKTCFMLPVHPKISPGPPPPHNNTRGTGDFWRIQSAI